MNQIIKNCSIGKNTKIWDFVNLYDCEIGDECIIGTFVEIQKNVSIGDKVKISSHSFICEGVTLEDNVFIGHHVVFVNDKYPRSTNVKGELKQDGDWKLQKTIVKKNASIGSNATILGGMIIGENSLIGAGSVVTKNVAKNVVVAGNPAKIIKKLP
ncbi:MAG: acetyltransferase [Candidatus Levybacteria bacterium RIFCSPHIGHO2_02_FULL_37_18]|nr:MAG: acetyltransferase [Candidatus Levybacteria bacterium RIFCSPHIGHO2_02_FULL_37_18]OGH33464.1 MAG: acetyltransferase [Candidatus Levybacteria bacterium RIFCSPLOWO2_01_FULL_37_20]OGH44037.1 MAG: acetyltransferase [Candidatus Levybacteria bacterium RIFCSPLOWO2_02_FULL_37_18]